MDTASLALYFKDIFLKERPQKQFFYWLSISLWALFIVLSALFHSIKIIGFGLVLVPLQLAFIIIGIFRDSYKDFKDYEYVKNHLPEKIERIQAKTDSETCAFLRLLNDRIKKLEEASFSHSAVYAFFLTLTLVAATVMALYLLPKILK